MIILTFGFDVSQIRFKVTETTHEVSSADLSTVRAWRDRGSWGGWRRNTFYKGPISLPPSPSLCKNSKNLRLRR
ncbi:hypothetical protein L6452_09961 [Arctium lappa]|uniref:Uncharacterized protein n=1 Tax=Arctium lappa TaxID=4217 RepID=A0ACB9DLS0_ARCLA|nr:hypothetical protein L6452_09961 [Arctium lappa]